LFASNNLTFQHNFPPYFLRWQRLSIHQLVWLLPKKDNIQFWNCCIIGSINKIAMLWNIFKKPLRSSLPKLNYMFHFYWMLSLVVVYYIIYYDFRLKLQLKDWCGLLFLRCSKIQN
jgi:hypothetical protein